MSKHLSKHMNKHKWSGPDHTPTAGAGAARRPSRNACTAPTRPALTAGARSSRYIRVKRGPSALWLRGFSGGGPLKLMGLRMQSRSAVRGREKRRGRTTVAGKKIFHGTENAGRVIPPPSPHRVEPGREGRAEWEEYEGEGGEGEGFRGEQSLRARRTEGSPPPVPVFRVGVRVCIAAAPPPLRRRRTPAVDGVDFDVGACAGTENGRGWKEGDAWRGACEGGSKAHCFVVRAVRRVEGAVIAQHVRGFPHCGDHTRQWVRDAEPVGIRRVRTGSGSREEFSASDASGGTLCAQLML
ncbi:hypothetical protein C8R47DRAFT_1282338 [Mycena vitilis]|nr:hypothetical protein C8R47DRAFT_1282338 [Mycena vitilis]